MPRPQASVRGNVVGNLVGRVPVFAVLRPLLLIGNIIWFFGLIEVHAAAVAVPQSLETFVVFNEQSIGGHVIAVDHEAVYTWINSPSRRMVAMISPPQPGIVDNDIATIHNHTARGSSARRRAADTAAYVEGDRRIGAVINSADVDIAKLQKIC